MRRTPIEIVAALGLDTERELSAARLQALAERRSSFEWSHLGVTDVAIGTLTRVLRETDGLCPPRSGHLGNWEDIALGRAGAMDFNHAICGRGLGYPLIYCFNQTEDSAGAAGDAVYMPGSLASRGERQILPLFTWDGAQLARRGRDVPLFVPFVFSELDGERVPLTRLHWQRMQRTGLRFRLEAAVIHEHRAHVRAMFSVLFDRASRHANPKRALGDLVSHAASLGGRVARASLVPDGDGYRLGETFFASKDALVDAALLPFAAVAEPDAFFSDMGALPPVLPVMAALVVGIFSAILGTHYPDQAIVRANMTQPFNPHLHWGARDMAGYPPKRSGYFSERSTIRSMRTICDALVGSFPEVDPIYFLLMPAAVFMLCPSDAHPRDAEVLASLFADVARETSGYAGATDDRMGVAIDGLVRRWLAGALPVLSSYFLHRFNARRGVLHGTEVPAASGALEPEGFARLSVRQACMIVGALTECLQPAGVS